MTVRFGSIVVLAIWPWFDHASAQSCTSTPPNVVSWWPGDGHAVDIVGGYGGILQNGVTFAVGEVGQGFSFDGSNDQVRVDDRPDLNPATFSIDAWVRPQEPQPTGGAVGFYGSIVAKGDGVFGSNTTYAFGARDDHSVSPSTHRLFSGDPSGWSMRAYIVGVGTFMTSMAVATLHLATAADLACLSSTTISGNGAGFATSTARPFVISSPGRELDAAVSLAALTYDRGRVGLCPRSH